MAAAQAKLNRAGGSHSGYIVRPFDLSIFGEAHFSAVERKIICALFSFSVHDFCEFTYPELKRRYRCSFSSVWRTIRKALDCLFKRGEKKRQYTFEGERKEDMLFFKIEEWLYFAQFEIEGEYFYLTNNEIEILSLLRDYQKRRWSTSQNFIADQLDISPSTVSVAVNRLKKMKLVSITFTEDGVERAVNHHTRAFYRVNEQLLAERKKELVKRAKGKSAAAKAADEATERSRYYDGLKQANWDRVEKLKKMLGAEYEEWERLVGETGEGGVLGMEIEKALRSGNQERLKELLQKRLEIKAAMREKLAKMGIVEQDLERHYVCPKCKDTGNLSNGKFCDCWKERRQ